MRGEQLTRSWGYPIRQPIITLFRRADLPPHDQEHDVEDGNLFGQVVQIWEFGEDVGEDFGEGVGVEAGGGVEEGGDRRVGGADEVCGRSAFGGAGAAVGEEVKEDGVERASGEDVANGDVVGE